MPLGIAAVVCAIAAGTAASLRAERWTGVVSLAIGYVPPVQQLANPAEVAQRLRSPTQVLEMSGLEHCIVDDEDVELPPDCPHHLVLECEVIENTTLVAFTVETDSLEKSRELVDHVTETILAEHGRLFDEVTQSNRQNIDEFEHLLARLEADLANRTPPRRGELSSLVADAETMSIWSQVVAVRRHLIGLRSNNLEARARPTRAVAGPEVEWKQRLPNPPLAALLGAFAGAAISGLVLAMRQAVRGRG